ncbi:MAG: M23 family metallopeptidase [Acidobacteria bacterium]|nr:M23 family metallopeptidase [Acidobacteriota bacterium]
MLVAGIAVSAGCARPASFPHDIPVSGGADFFLPLEGRTIEGVFPRRSTLAAILDSHELDGPAAQDIIAAAGEVFDPRRFRAGNEYRVVVGNDGFLRRLEYHVDEDKFLQVRRAGAGGTYDAALVPYEKQRVETVTRGFINREQTSLVAALNRSGENVTLAIKMAEVLAGEIDFNTEVRRGDRFDVLFEKHYREDQFSSYGDVVAVQFINDGRPVQAFRFTVPGDSEPLYYDHQGRSLKRQFLRSPFNFEPRVTSRFSNSRLHPVLGVHRPHLGVDYGAPTGTPVIAVATGTVVSAGRSRGSGNMVRLRHNNGYETYYLHLSAFAPGIRKGARVIQGQTIGRVGATGLATGPHLDYRMRKNGAFVNPLLEHRRLPPGEPVPEQHLEAFERVRDQAIVRLALSSSPAGESDVLAQ